MTARDLLQLLKDSVQAWSEDKASRLAAALSYYTVFSIAPLLVIVIGVAGLALGEEAVRGELVAQISDTVGQETAEFVQTLIANASEPSSGIIATVVGVITLLLGASGVFGQLQGALDTIWGVEAARGRGIAGTIKDRFLGFAMVLGIGFLLMVALVASAAIGVASRFLGEQLPIPAGWLSVLDFALSFAVITLLFALIFKLLPRVEIAWQDVWLGAAVTSALFNVGKLLIGWYLGTSGAGSAFGAAGSLIVLLLWVYYSAQIFLLGAEFTKVYANRYGSHPQPEAVPAPSQVAAATQSATKEIAPASAVPGEAAPAYHWAIAVAISFVTGLLVAGRRR